MVLSGRAIFWPLFGKIKKNPRNGFCHNFPKTLKKHQICLFLRQMSGFRENEIFFQKSGRAMFLAFFALNIQHSSGPRSQKIYTQ